MLALVDEELVPGAVLLLGLAVAAVDRLERARRPRLARHQWALVGRVFGTLAGAYAVTRLDHDAMAIVLGVLVLLAVAISLSGWHVRPTTSTLVGAGMVSGVMGTLTSVGGPPMALVYQREQAAKLRSTLAGFFLFGASLALVALAVSGELGGRQVVDGLVLLPGLLVGLAAQPAAGSVPRPRMDARRRARPVDGDGHGARRRRRSSEARAATAHRRPTPRAASSIRPRRLPPTIAADSSAPSPARS